MSVAERSDVVALFLELAALSSPTGHERAVNDRVIAYLRDLGLTVDEDDAGRALKGDAGNLYCRLPATAGEQGLPLFFCAHTDTVPPVAPVEPVVSGGLISNRNEAILGADDKSALAAMLDAVRRVVGEGRPHAGIELVITVQEEVGLLGAKAFDHDRLHADHGYVFDHGGAIGGIVVAGPSQFTVEATFTGRAAHSGIAPEEGRSAIAAAARAIAELRLGRIDEQTTANVGTIRGGTARNIVPESCHLLAEVRSLDAGKAHRELQTMLDAMLYAANGAECTLETKVTDEYQAYRLKRADPVVALASEALEGCGHEVRLVESGGGADAHVFNARGRRCVNLANAMQLIHTPQECIAVADVESMVDVSLALIEGARHRRVDSPPL